MAESGDEEDTRVIRQYSCGKCSERRPFWNKVPKQQCDNCDEWLYPVLKNDEIGYGEFTCDECDNKFTNGKARWYVTQPCYGANGTQTNRKCSENVLPHSVGPYPRLHQRKSMEKEHRCAGCAEGACKHRPVSKTAPAAAK
eukprot:scpid88393/ scgid14347/ 